MHKRTAFFFEIRVKRAFAVLTRKDVVTPYPYFVLRTPLVLCQRRQVSTQSCSLQYVRGTTQGESGILPRLARTPSTGGQGQIGLPQQIANWYEQVPILVHDDAGIVLALVSFFFFFFNTMDVFVYFRG